ncbi:hypothetical protein VCHENC02_5851B, partial [Vibrio harveyi]
REIVDTSASLKLTKLFTRWSLMRR